MVSNKQQQSWQTPLRQLLINVLVLPFVAVATLPNRCIGLLPFPLILVISLRLVSMVADMASASNILTTFSQMVSAFETYDSASCQMHKLTRT